MVPPGAAGCGPAYGIEAEKVDGMDLALVVEATERAVSMVRETKRPRFLELETYRFRAHSMYDAELYRTKEEVRGWMLEHDPIDVFEAWLGTQGWIADGDEAEIEKRVAAEIDAAVAEAEAGPLEPVESLTSYVYTEALR